MGAQKGIVNDGERSANLAAVAHALDAFSNGGHLQFRGNIGINIGRMEAAGEHHPIDVRRDLGKLGLVDTQRRNEAIGKVEDTRAHLRQFHAQMLRALEPVVPIHDRED